MELLRLFKQPSQSDSASLAVGQGVAFGGEKDYPDELQFVIDENAEQTCPELSHILARSVIPGGSFIINVPHLILRSDIEFNGEPLPEVASSRDRYSSTQ